jgi:hypothetical protein
MNLGIGLGVTNFLRVPAVPLDPDAAIAALFESGEEGAWYDPSDLTTLYQDSIGTTPAGVGDPVGLMLDKSKGGVSATELLTNGTFDTDTDWTKFNATISGGQATMTVGYVQQGGLGLVVGRKYKMTWDVVSTTSSTMRVYCGTTASVAGSIIDITTGAGSYSAILTAGTVGDFVRFSGGNGTTVYDNISVKELPGNHATQSTSTARPVLQSSGGLWYLDFDGVDDYMRSSSFSAIAQPISAAVGFRASNTPAFIIDGHDANELSIITINVGGVDKLRLVSGDTNPFFVVDYTYGGDTVARVLANGASSVIAIDGAETVGAASATAAVTAWNLGVSGVDTFELDGRIYGFVGIDRTLTAGEIGDLESYLADKSGVTLP